MAGAEPGPGEGWERRPEVGQSLQEHFKDLGFSLGEIKDLEQRTAITWLTCLKDHSVLRIGDSGGGGGGRNRETSWR